LERAASAWALFRATSRQIAATGLLVRTDEGPRRNPLLIVRKQACEELTRCTADLGLSPRARTKLVEAEAENDDPLSILLTSWERDRAAGLPPHFIDFSSTI
jgi:P27 family predicted phage terminase small subunit